jgi:hypothetical protein
VCAFSPLTLFALLQKVPEEAGMEIWLKRGDSAATPCEDADEGENIHTKERRESG